MSLRATIGVVNDREILLVVQSFDLVRILNGERTALLRNTLPKGFVGWVNLYCAKGGKLLINKDFLNEFYNVLDVKEPKKYIENSYFTEVLNGKVAARFWFDEHKEYWFEEYFYGYVSQRTTFLKKDEEALKKLCLTYKEIEEYGKVWATPCNYADVLYAWHIKQLEIFDTPKELCEFKVKLKYKSPRGFTYWKAVETPHNWLYVYRKEEENENGKR